MTIRPPKVIISQALRLNLRWGISWGLGFAAIFTAFAALAELLGALPESNVLPLRVLVLLYFGGGEAAGGVVGALRPLTRNVAGSILVGIMAAWPAALLLLPHQSRLDSTSRGSSARR